MLFEIRDEFVEDLKETPPPFGWNGLGELVYLRTYSRDGENWYQTCRRVINGMYSIQKGHCLENGLTWNEDKGQRSAAHAFHMLFDLKWSPPGRGLWSMGTPFVHERHVPEALQNCAFVSTDGIHDASAFEWLMTMSMVGVGVGFDTRGAHSMMMIRPGELQAAKHVVGDSREGWGAAFRVLIESYMTGTPSSGTRQAFDYDKVRPYGSPIRGFGGIASGPGPLKELLEDARLCLDQNIGRPLRSRTIVDLMNMAGRCVIAGNVRRSAEIAIGDPNDDEFIGLKDYDAHPDRASYGWVSNNSVLADDASYQRLDQLAEMTWQNGEPGYIWMNNVQKYGRMNGEIARRDYATGFNPCVEQPLEDGEMCTLVEVYPSRCSSKLEFAQASKFAYLYAKSVTLMNEHMTDSNTREIMMRNRRIGMSMTGLAQFQAIHGGRKLQDWLRFAYEFTGYWDEMYSKEWLNVPTSIRRTTVKPSGTVSLLAGVTPGIHHPISRHYLRRVRLADDSELIPWLQERGLPLEDAIDSPNTLVTAFPVDAGPGLPNERNVSMAEQMRFAAMVQHDYADNAVSVTIKFDQEVVSPHMLKEAILSGSQNLKAVAFLPHDNHGYAQAPYESITAHQYGNLTAQLRDIPWTGGAVHEVEDKMCDTDICEVVA